MRSPPGATWNQESSGSETGDLERDPLREPARPDGELPSVAGGCGVGLEPEVRLLRACGAGRKVEGLADGALRLQPDPDDVVGGRPEAIGVREIAEAPEQRGGVPLLLRAPVDLDDAIPPLRPPHHPR